MKLYEQNPHYVRYVALLEQLHALIRDGRGDGPEADSVREQMDGPWRHLTPEETARVREISAVLSSAAGPEGGPSLPAQTAARRSLRLVVSDDPDAAREGIRALLRDTDVEVVSLAQLEVRVLRELAGGRTHKEIADLFQINVEVVKEHVRLILQKLGAEEEPEQTLQET